MNTMKIQIKVFTRRPSVLLYGTLFLFLSLQYACQYDEIVDTDYPAGTIYMPIAYDGAVYSIDEITQPTLAVPTTGSAYRYAANRGTNEFRIPLGIYRSGVHPGEAVTVHILRDPSVIDRLKADAELGDDVLLLPEGKYSMTESVRMESGQREASFDLMVDFSFLRNQTPDVYALGIVVSCSEQEVNPDLNTVVVLIDTKMMLPVPSFTYSASPINGTELSFLNASQFALSYSWNFGDGSESSNEKAPMHRYPSLNEDKEYTVRLSAEGLYGDVVVYEEVVTIAKVE